MRGAWTLPLLLALLIVACADRSVPGASSDTSPVTVPSSRPSPGGPTTTSLFDEDLPLWQRTPELPKQTFDYGVSLPEHFSVGVGPFPAAIALDDTPAINPVTDAGATLGRVLFYDLNMSSTRGLSCASCHLQSNSFTDRTRFSLGSFGSTTRRNSMSLANLMFNETGAFFWDERAVSLEAQAIDPFADPIELSLAPEEVVQRILALDYYEPLFEDAFGDGSFDEQGVTMDRVGLALAQFMRSMTSTNAPYDAGRAMVDNPQDNFPTFTEQENEGKTIFFTPATSGGGGCAGCHMTEAFIGPATADGNNGLDPGDTADLGVYEITSDEAQRSSFRVSSLRNVEVTGPYMHDGRFATLEEVIDHYSDNIAPHPNLSIRLQDANGNPVRPSFSSEDKAALLAFLQTLTDRTFLTDVRFSDPFQ